MSTHVRQGSLVDSHSMNHSQNQLKSEQASDSPIARSFDYVGIFGSVIESGIFQKVNITEIALARSVAQIKLIPSVARLIDDFKTAGLAATVGFSPTNETLSFSLTVQTEYIGFSSSESKIIILRSMLNLVECQESLEESFASTQQGKGLFANFCLSIFASQTGLSVIEIRPVVGSPTIKISLGAAKRKPNAGVKNMFKYGNFYWKYAAYDKSSGLFSEERHEGGIKRLTSELGTIFWNALADFPFCTSDSMVSVLRPYLEDHISSELNRSARSWQPGGIKSHMIYLYGEPGTGKSTFITAFEHSLSACYRTGFCGDKEVKVVKVPLNSTNPTQVKSTIFVQGISDWSLERVVEQSVCKGHTVILHLEECPACDQLQIAYLDMFKELVATTQRRYPRVPACIFTVFTSNFEPTESLRRSSQVTLRLDCVCPDRQAAWCRSVVQRTLGMSGLSIQGLPPCWGDMRPLRRWSMSLAYHLSRYFADASLEAIECEHQEPMPSPENRLGQEAQKMEMRVRIGAGGTSVEAVADIFRECAGISGPVPWALSGIVPPGPPGDDGGRSPRAHGMVTGPRSSSPRQAESWSAGVDTTSPPDSPHTPSHLQSAGMIPIDGEEFARVGPGTGRRLRLRMVDGGLLVRDRDRGSEDSEGVGRAATGTEDLDTLVGMCAGGWLQPAVLLASGSGGGQSAMTDRVVSRAAALCGSDVPTLRVRVGNSGDETVVTGESRSIRGGLLKAIDDFTNPNVTIPADSKRSSLLVVICEVRGTSNHIKLLRTSLTTRFLALAANIANFITLIGRWATVASLCYGSFWRIV
mmetsp:Transcript_49883/g.131270  ORF Transcript_49883/g.131270 Transcript_49883/m.131270 type:complete len:811 (-) Transcript_49883:388-2820(-)